MRNTAIAVMLALLPWPCLGQEASWPDLSSPARAVGGGEHDAAVVVGVEGYFAVPGVPGAKSNAKQWYEYLTETRGVPAQNVKFLTNEDATREEILDASRKMAGRASPKGTLWFVFVGHGAPSPDGKDGLLIGVDAQQKAESLETRGLRRQELLKALAQSKAGTIVAVLDACFSGRGQDGNTIAPGLQPLMTVAAAGVTDPRMVVLTAAKGNQFAGALPGASRPAFSYLVLGGLRGWAAEGNKAAVTAGDLWRYATNALEATLRGRNQTPDLMGKEDTVVGVSAGEKGPSLAKLAEATAGRSAVEFKVSALPEVPRANMPSLSAVDGLPRLQLPGDISRAEGMDFGSMDVEALGKFDEAVKFEKGLAAPEAKAARWRALGAEVKTYREVAAKRAAQWDEYAEQVAFNAALENDKTPSAPEAKAAKWKELASKYPKYRQATRQRVQEWERYAKELAAAEAARQKRIELMDKDWTKLKKMLSYSVVSAADKQKFALTFVQAYGKTSEDNPHVAELAPYLSPGAVEAPPVTTGKAGIEWVTIPGGSFMMGSGSGDGRPRHRVMVKTFQMTKTLVTVRQYRECVQSGAPRARQLLEGLMDQADQNRLHEGACPNPTAGNPGPQGDNYPRVEVNWGDAQAFAKWAGGRLPTEAEWEYAARSGGLEQKYPWGDEKPNCDLAVFRDSDQYGCGKSESWPVCSKPKGNTKQGLCDMAGNVFEWVQDWYHDSYKGAPTDGSAWENSAGSPIPTIKWDQGRGGIIESLDRVIRGGSYKDDSAKALRVDFRSHFHPNPIPEEYGQWSWNGDNSVGFRLARDSQ